MKHKRNGNRYALKRSKSQNSKDNTWLLRCCREITILADLRHSNVVCYHAAFIERGIEVGILMEYCDCDLSAAFEDEDLTRKKIRPHALQLYSQIIDGLQYVHDKNLIHRDLKPANILLCEGKELYTAKIGDFGFSRYQDTTQSIGGGTPLYRAPEQLTGEYNYLADIYSSGLILFELLARQKHYCGYRRDWRGVLHSLRIPDCTEGVLKEFEPFLQGMKNLLIIILDHNPQKRPKSAKHIQEELCSL